MDAANFMALKMKQDGGHYAQERDMRWNYLWRCPPKDGWVTAKLSLDQLRRSYYCDAEFCCRVFVDCHGRPFNDLGKTVRECMHAWSGLQLSMTNFRKFIDSSLSGEANADKKSLTAIGLNHTPQIQARHYHLADMSKIVPAWNALYSLTNKNSNNSNNNKNNNNDGDDDDDDRDSDSSDDDGRRAVMDLAKLCKDVKQNTNALTGQIQWKVIQHKRPEYAGIDIRQRYRTYLKQHQN